MQAAPKPHRVGKSVDWYLHYEWIIAAIGIVAIVGWHWLHKHG